MSAAMSAVRRPPPPVVPCFPNQQAIKKGVPDEHRDSATPHRHGGRTARSLWAHGRTRQTCDSSRRAAFDRRVNWVQIYREAGLDDVQVTSGPFEMMTAAGFVRDEGIANSLAVMGRALSRRSYLKRMA